MPNQSKINCYPSYIVDLYSTAKEHGAIGGKLLGAGAGGFFLVFAKPEFHENIIKALSPKNSVVPIELESEFYPVREEHQNYYKKKPLKYYFRTKERYYL